MKPMLLPNPTDFDLERARLCARLVQQAYDMFEQWDRKKPDEDSFNWKKPAPPVAGLAYGDPLWAAFRYKQTTPAPNSKVQPTVRFVDRYCPIGFIATLPDQVFVIFRGTETDYERMKVDFKFLQKDCDFDRFSEGKAHDGFLTYYKTLRKTLLQRIGNLNPNGKQLILAGHSLGAALSTLAAHDLAEQDYASATFEHVNFGSPRIFDANLAAYYDTLPVPTYRVVNVEDIVTTAPPPVLSKLVFQHIGTPLSFSAQYGAIGKNHAMENYLYALENPNQPQRP